MTTDFSFLAKLNWKVDTKPLDAADAATKKLTKDTTSLGKGSKKTEKDAKGLSKGIESVEKSSKRAKDSLGKLGNGVVNLGKNFAKMTLKAGLAGAAVAAAAVAATAVSMVNTNKETTTENKEARAAGFKKGEEQKYVNLGSAIKSLGFDMKNVGDMSNELNKTLGEVKADPKKLKEFKAQLKDIGIEYKGFSELPQGEKLKTLLGSLSGFKDKDKATSIAEKILKGEATKIVTAISNSGTTLDQMVLKQKELSLETQNSRKGAEDFSLALDTLMSQFDSIKAYTFGELGKELAPLVTQMSKFLADNQALIKEKLDVFVKSAADGFKSLFTYLSDEKNQKAMKETFGSIIKFLKEAAPYVEPIAKISAALLALSALTAIGKSISVAWSVIVPIFEAIGVAAGVSAGVVGVLTAGILGFGYAIYSVWADRAFIKGLFKGWFEDITKWFSELWDDISETVSNVVDKIVGFLEPIKTFFSDLYDNYISPIINAVSKITGIKVPKAPVAAAPSERKPVDYGDASWDPNPTGKSWGTMPKSLPGEYWYPKISSLQTIPRSIGTQTSGSIPVAQSFVTKSNDVYTVNNDITLNVKTTERTNPQELARTIATQVSKMSENMFQARSKRT
jgi:hypothetical protein